MNFIFRSWLRRYVLEFFDDILVYSTSWEEYTSDLRIVFALLLQHQFFVNGKKCHFGKQSVEYLGHIISFGGVAMDLTKVQTVIDWPIPSNAKGVRGFLGLIRYYQRFIKDYGKIDSSLTALTTNEGFTWNSKTQAFDSLKRHLTTFPILALPDFSKEFAIECDASCHCVGAILMQDGHKLAYYNKALAPHTFNKSIYEKEVMALVLAVQHWRHYLLGRPFKVYTDQKSLKHLLQQRITTTEQHCWLAKLMGVPI